MEHAIAEHEADGFVVVYAENDVTSMAKWTAHDTYRVICLRRIGDDVMTTNNGAMYWAWSAIRSMYGTDCYESLTRNCEHCGTETLWTRGNGYCEDCEADQLVA